MNDALARSVAETAAEDLWQHAGGLYVSDEIIGMYLWNRRGFRDQADLVAIINHTREILDRRDREARAVGRRPRAARQKPKSTLPKAAQLTMDWEAA